MSLIELMVASTLMLVGLVVFGSVLFTVQRASDRQFELSSANDSARLAIQELDRQMRSGYVVAQPAISGTSASAVVYTEARMRNPGDVPKCVAWVVAPYGSSDALYTRTWDAANTRTTITWAPGDSAWRRLLEGVVNRSQPGGPAPFTLSTVSTPAGVILSQLLSVRLFLNPSTVRDSQVTEIRSVITARNYLRGDTRALDLRTGGLNVRSTLCQIS